MQDGDTFKIVNMEETFGMEVSDEENEASQTTTVLGKRKQKACDFELNMQTSQHVPQLS